MSLILRYRTVALAMLAWWCVSVVPVDAGQLQWSRLVGQWTITQSSIGYVVDSGAHRLGADRFYMRITVLGQGAFPIFEIRSPDFRKGALAGGFYVELFSDARPDAITQGTLSFADAGGDFRMSFTEKKIAGLCRRLDAAKTLALVIHDGRMSASGASNGADTHRVAIRLGRLSEVLRMVDPGCFR